MHISSARHSFLQEHSSVIAEPLELSSASVYTQTHVHAFEISPGLMRSEEDLVARVGRRKKRSSSIATAVEPWKRQKEEKSLARSLAGCVYIYD